MGLFSEIIGGYAFDSSSLKAPSGERVIRISDINESGFVNNKIVRYSGTPIAETYRIRQFDILMAMTGGTVGKSLYVKEMPEDSLLLNQRVAIIRNHYIDSDYLDLVIKAPHIMDVINSRKNSTNDNISMVDIYKFLIPVPAVAHQKAIVKGYTEILPLLHRFDIAQNELDLINQRITPILKKSILQEAIQGKLVLQIAEEGTAQELLEQIRQEKQKLVKEGKLKKSALSDSVIFKGDDNKYYEQVGDNTQPIELDYCFPNTWEAVKLSHICRLTDGEKREGDNICLDAKYLRGKSIGDILPRGKYVAAGDNIILVDGENSGEVFTVPRDGYMGSTFKQLWVSENMHLPYMLYFIQFYKNLLRNSKKGAAIPHLNKDIFYSLVIGIPPYQEQERIAKRIQEITDRIKAC